ncbi:MAG: DUF4199 domain-containing protein [Bacteroidetes bacterium]|nr:MAG: DUF4199 domain-containing protein [Bacteroidota bacterium]
MEEKVNAWKTNLTNGLIMGLAGIAYSLLIYFLNLTFNKAQGIVFVLIQIGLLYFLLKSYRDNFRHGQITYGQSVGAGVIICLYYSLIMAVFTYILYTVIDSGLVSKQLAFAEEAMVKKGIPQSAIDAGMAIQTKIMKPAIMAPISIFGSMIWGVIISLLVSIFIKKEGNPLIDSPSN